MTLRFIHPPLSGPVTGGNRYNQNLIRTAERLGIGLDSVEWSGQADITELLAAFESRCDLLLWDSLFLRNLAEGPNLGGWPRQGLLVHYLPYTNPLLGDSERVEWQHRFQRVALGMRFLLTTGSRVAADLRQQYPHCPVFLREPEVDPAFRGRRGCRVHNHERAVRLITVANLLPAKRQRELLEMLARIEADWEWHLAGEAGLDPGYADSLRERIRQLGLTRRVVWHGSLPPDELAGLMASMDLFVCYSAFESYGMALAEAAAVGLPILTTDVGEAERLVENGGSRGLVIPVDRADLFEQALTKLLRDGTFRRSLGARPSPPSSETV